MKKVFFSLAFMLITMASFANTQNGGKPNANGIEKLNLGDISNLSIKSSNFNATIECTISVTATVTIGVASVSLSVSATAADCAAATAKAIRGLRGAIQVARATLTPYLTPNEEIFNEEQENIIAALIAQGQGFVIDENGGIRLTE